MKSLTLFFIFILIISCNKNINTQILEKDVFINQPGIYYLKNNKLIIKKFDNGSLVYGIGTKLNRPMYEHSIFMPFSNNQYWTIYIDTNENIWFYTADLQIFTLITKEKKSNNYKLYDGPKQDIKFPKKFIDELSKHNLKVDNLINDL